MPFRRNSNSPTTFSELEKDQAHIWHCNLDRIPSHIMDASFNADERERAAEFHFDRDRDRFLIGRGVLRCLLAHYLCVPPSQPQFTINEHGKPELQDNPQSLRFNVSHSGDQALFAFCLERDIGVDIECRRPDLDAEKITRLANRFFTPGESQTLNSLEETEKQAAFYRLWTRKEALLKAIGTGVAGGLAKYEVSVLADEKASVLAPIDEARQWSLFDVPVASQNSAALAFKIQGATNHDLQHWHVEMLDLCR